MSIELEISELEGKIEELKKFSVEQGIDFSKQIEELEAHHVQAVLIGETLMKAKDKKAMLENLKG